MSTSEPAEVIKAEDLIVGDHVLTGAGRFVGILRAADLGYGDGLIHIITELGDEFSVERKQFVVVSR